MNRSSTAQAFANIALIKYWGNRQQALRLPANGSISFNLDGLYARTRVQFSSELTQDQLILNGQAQVGAALERVSRFLDAVRTMAGMKERAVVQSENNFPMGAGIASSAAASAALRLAGSRAAGSTLSEAHLSRRARLRSGSACR